VHRLILIAISTVLITTAQVMLIGPTPAHPGSPLGPAGWDIGFSAAFLVAWMVPVYASLWMLRRWIMRTKAD